jgi:hypothetical protein
MSGARLEVLQPEELPQMEGQGRRGRLNDHFDDRGREAVNCVDGCTKSLIEALNQLTLSDFAGGATFQRARDQRIAPRGAGHRLDDIAENDGWRSPKKLTVRSALTKIWAV